MPLDVSNLTPEHAALAAVAYLMVKHAAADFVLQTQNQRSDKGTYGRTGGLTHAATHVALTAPVFLAMPSLTAPLIAGLLALEFIIHYHIDWLKEQLVRRNGWTTHDTPFWWAIGIDQMLHGLTYVGLLWIAFGA